MLKVSLYSYYYTDDITQKNELIVPHNMQKIFYV